MLARTQNSEQIAYSSYLVQLTLYGEAKMIKVYKSINGYSSCKYLNLDVPKSFKS